MSYVSTEIYTRQCRCAVFTTFRCHCTSAFWNARRVYAYAAMDVKVGEPAKVKFRRPQGGDHRQCNCRQSTDSGIAAAARRNAYVYIDAHTAADRMTSSDTEVISRAGELPLSTPRSPTAAATVDDVIPPALTKSTSGVSNVDGDKDAVNDDSFESSDDDDAPYTNKVHSVAHTSTVYIYMYTTLCC